MASDRIEQCKKEIPERLKNIMKEYGEDNLTVATNLHVSERTVQRWLYGESLPSAEDLLAIYFEYGESIEWFFGLERG